MTCGDFFLVVLALLFPPLPVWVKRGICSADSLINIALCVLGVLPGLVHAWYIISIYPEARYEQIPEPERGVVTHPHVHAHPHPQSGHKSYGTITAAENGSGSGAQHDAPPSYQESVKGDNKVQGP